MALASDVSSKVEVTCEAKDETGMKLVLLLELGRGRQIPVTVKRTLLAVLQISKIERMLIFHVCPEWGLGSFGPPGRGRIYTSQQAIYHPNDAPARKGSDSEQQMCQST